LQKKKYIRQYKYIHVRNNKGKEISKYINTYILLTLPT
jgi:hypothetical protein